MRKLAVVVAVLMLATSPMLMAGEIRDNCGCGFGTMALDGSNPTIVAQLSATFLNSISGNQTFGISSGTLDCNPSAGLVYNKEMQRFVGENMDQLALDMAQGRGDTLDALADLLAVNVDERTELFTALQGNFDRIFSTEDVTTVEVLASIEAVIGS